MFYIRINNAIYPELPISVVRMLGSMMITINTLWDFILYLCTKNSLPSKKKKKKTKKRRTKKFMKPKIFLRRHLDQTANWINILQPIDLCPKTINVSWKVNLKKQSQYHSEHQ